MKLSRLFCICVVFLFVYTFSVSMPFAQDLEGFEGDVIKEKRPFDFSDKFYEKNGVDPVFIIDKRTGNDRYSVIDFIDSDDHRNVRILETRTGYSYEGKPLYFNFYGQIFKNAFTLDRNGEQASKTAEAFPIYTFPSALVKGSDRQAALIETRDGYFEKNQLGLGVVVLIEYTRKIHTQKGMEVLEELEKINGTSLDGTPIIRTVKEIEYLTRENLVTQKVRGLDDETQPPFMIAKVLEKPETGAIAPDAFLEMVWGANGKPLASEKVLADEFECLQKSGSWCSGKR